jgi:hypothetical protein
MMGAAASQLSRRVDNYMRECVFEASSASGARVQGRPTTGFFGRPAFFAGLIITLLRPLSRRPSGTHGHAAQDTALQRHTPHPSHATSASLGLQSPQALVGLQVWRARYAPASWNSRVRLHAERVARDEQLMSSLLSSSTPVAGEVLCGYRATARWRCVRTYMAVYLCSHLRRGEAR